MVLSLLLTTRMHDVLAGKKPCHTAPIAADRKDKRSYPYKPEDIALEVVPTYYMMSHGYL